MREAVEVRRPAAPRGPAARHPRGGSRAPVAGCRWTRSGSARMSPTRRRGLSEEEGSWKTICTVAAGTAAAPRRDSVRDVRARRTRPCRRRRRSAGRGSGRAWTCRSPTRRRGPASRPARPRATRRPPRARPRGPPRGARDREVLDDVGGPQQHLTARSITRDPPPRARRPTSDPGHRPRSRPRRASAAARGGRRGAASRRRRAPPAMSGGRRRSGRAAPAARREGAARRHVPAPTAATPGWPAAGAAAGARAAAGSSRAAPRCRGAGGRRRPRPRARLDDAAGVHHQHPVGDLGHHAHVVGDEHDRRAVLAPQPPQQVEDLRLHGDVERGRRLVGDQQRGVAGQRHGDHRALAHPAGELVRVAVDAPRGVGDADLAQQLHGPRAAPRPSTPARGRGSARRSASRPCRPGVSAVIGSCKIIAMSRPRSAAAPARAAPRGRCPRKRACPSTRAVGVGTRPRRRRQRHGLARAATRRRWRAPRPGSTSKETPSTATSRARVGCGS